MLPYFLLFGIPAGYCLGRNWLNIKMTYRRKEFVLNFFFGCFLVILMCRNITCGTDLRNYAAIFSDAVLSPFRNSYEVEWGYNVLESIIGLFTKDYQVNLVILALISVIPIYIMYKKEVEIPYLTIILFLTVAPFSMYFSGMRQVVAMAFAVPVYYFSREKRILPSLLTVAASSLFHKSAWVMIVFYPVYHLQLTKKSLIWLIPGLVFTLAFNQQIFTVILHFMGDRYIEKYSTTTSTGAYSILILLIIFVVYSFLLVRDVSLDKNVVGLRNILLLTAVIQCFAPIHSIAMRMNYYFLPFIPILIPKIANRCSSKNRAMAKLSVIVLCLGLTAIYLREMYTGADILNIYPYVPFWGNEN